MHNLPNLPKRKPLRFAGYDYSRPGAYFVTMRTVDHSYLFGEVARGGIQLTSFGEIARSQWLALPDRFPGLKLDAFVVMPNHLHGILAFTHQSPAPTHSASHHTFLQFLERIKRSPPRHPALP